MANKDYAGYTVVKSVKNRPVAPPETVRVRALERLFGKDLLIHNPGEIFDMETSVMRCVPPKMSKGTKTKPSEPIGGPIPDEATIIETESGKYELPPTVELAPEGADATPNDRVAPDTAGHRTTFREGMDKAGVL